MKGFILIAVLVVFNLVTYGQINITRDDITKFLGIPVDGDKKEIINSIKEKGFIKDNQNRDILIGEFNGYDVEIYVVANRNKVYRIMVCDKYFVDEVSIKTRYNTLCDQFEINDNYKNWRPAQTRIPVEEDISYEMAVNSKCYQAVYYQNVSDSINNIIQEKTSEFSAKWKLDSIIYHTPELMNEYLEDRNKICRYLDEVCTKKKVWFTIKELNGNYGIIMYYDNEYNKPNGEDL